ncbi:MAG: TatD family hydrolase [Patescibacteria group bacterium]
MKFIDTHAHIQFAAYDDILDKVLADAAEHETGVIVVGCEQESSEAAVALVKDRPGLWAAVGQHPTDTGLPFDIKKFRELAEYEKVVAVGECGLDYYRLDGSEVLRLEVIEKQKELFEAQITLAHERNVPLIIHCRDAHPDMIAILLKRFSTPSSHPHPPKEHGVLHCFTGTVADAQSYLDLNFLISFTGIITFADQYDDVVRRVPLEKMLIETDSPFLTPKPHRGKKNHPSYVRFVAERIAEIKGVSTDEVARQTTENARRLFHLS